MTEKQEHILLAALALFAEDGYDATPTSCIAKEAKVSEGLIFKHFGSKEGLLEAVLALGGERMAPLVAEIVRSEDPRSLVRLVIALPSQLLGPERLFWRLQFSLKWQRRQMGGQMPAYILPLYHKLVWALERLGFRQPEEEAQLLYLTLESLSQLLILHGESEQSRRLLKLLEEKYVPG
jgi:AcrR family transcriptional regulator